MPEVELVYTIAGVTKAVMGVGFGWFAGKAIREYRYSREFKHVEAVRKQHIDNMWDNIIHAAGFFAIALVMHAFIYTRPAS